MENKKFNKMVLYKNTLVDALGIEFTEISKKCICGKMPVDHRTRQPFGLLHGGASAAFAETLGSVGGNLLWESEADSVVGVEINANHLKSVKKGYVYGKAEPIKLGRSIQVWEIRIKNDLDQLVCVSRLTMAVIKK